MFLLREALDNILASALDHPETTPDLPPIWDLILENMKDILPEDFVNLPNDGASEHDHYLYGHRKRAQ